MKWCLVCSKLHDPIFLVFINNQGKVEKVHHKLAVRSYFRGHIMNIDDYSFHDAKILQVTEDSEQHSFEFLLDFPVDWENNVFEHKILKFIDVIFYSIDEIPFEGKPTILNIINFGLINKTFGQGRNQIVAQRTKIEMQTNAGNRIIEFMHCDLLTV